MQNDETRTTGGPGAQGATGRDSSGAGAGARGADDFGEYDRTYYPRHYETTYGARPGTVTYDEARTGYELGHRAASNPQYAEREFTEVEVELRRDFGEDRESRFEQIRDFAQHAFDWRAIVGGIALAAGGWWAGQKLFESLGSADREVEEDCRAFYTTHPAAATVPYDRARTLYVLGHTASSNPEYRGRSFDEIEPNLRAGFTGSRSTAYEPLRDFARRGYEQGSRAWGSSATGTAEGARGSIGSTGSGTGSDGGPTL